MKIVIQRVQKASVEVSFKEIAKIGKGYVLMLGVAKNDTDKDLDYLVEKIVNLRLFENKEAKFDKDLSDVGGEVLIISQFTLFANCSKGRRPYFGDACKPKEANNLYEKFIKRFKDIYDHSKVKSGEFAAKMLVEIHNDGPVTIILNSR